MDFVYEFRMIKGFVVGGGDVLNERILRFFIIYNKKFPATISSIKSLHIPLFYSTIFLFEIKPR